MFYDLIYSGRQDSDSCKSELQTAFTDAKIEDASDEIHRGRFSISIPCYEEDEILIFLLTHGYFFISLRLQILRIQDAKRVLALAKRANVL